MIASLEPAKAAILDRVRRVDEREVESTKTELDQMCQKLLANTVIESYRVEFVG